MGKVHEIRARAEIAAPANILWERVQEHDLTHTWVKDARVQVIEEGTPRNGMGAVRTVEFPSQPLWTKIYERVVFYEPPREWHYVLYKGMPGLESHLGKVCVDDLGGGRSAVRWEIDMSFHWWHPMAWYAPRFVRIFGRLIQQALDELKQQVEEKCQ